MAVKYISRHEHRKFKFHKNFDIQMVVAAVHPLFYIPCTTFHIRYELTYQIILQAAVIEEVYEIKVCNSILIFTMF